MSEQESCFSYYRIPRFGDVPETWVVQERIQLSFGRRTTRKVARFRSRGEAIDYADWRNGRDDAGDFHRLKAERDTLKDALQCLVESCDRVGERLHGVYLAVARDVLRTL